jgi:hypothetical protein
MQKLREYEIQGIRASVCIRIFSLHVWDPKINKCSQINFSHNIIKMIKWMQIIWATNLAQMIQKQLYTKRRSEKKPFGRHTVNGEIILKCT